MQKPRSKKWLLLFSLVLVLIMISTACATRGPDHNRANNIPERAIPHQQLSQGSHEIEGHIVSWNRAEGTVSIDQVEFLTATHHDRIQALGLDREKDFRHGYYVHNLNRDTVTLPLAANLQVRLAENHHRDGGLNDGYRLNSRLRSDGATNGIIDDAYGVYGNAYGNRRYDGGIVHSSYGMGEFGTDLAHGRIGEAARDVGDGFVHAAHGLAGGIVGGIDLLSHRYTDGIVADANRAIYFITIENGRVTSISEAHAYHRYNPHYNGHHNRPTVNH